MAVTTKDSKSFQDVVRDAAAQLVWLDVHSGGHYVTTPLMYANGGFVVVRVEPAADKFFVSDFGAGFEEAQLIGEEATFKKVARTVAEANGIGFDTFAFFSIEVSLSQLPGAIAAIANSSQEAVNVTNLKASERKRKDDNAELFDRLSGVFGKDTIARDAAILGASNTEWHVASLVSVSRRQIAFEAVSKHPNSVVHAAAKFSDITRIEEAPRCVSVVRSKKSLGTYLGVLSHNSSVIERAVDDRVYLSLAEAA